MAGFLDRQTRVIDMVLTGYGKSLLSKGALNFCYWVPFDDEIDYDPYIADSGSLSAAQLSSSIDREIENTPIREATTGYRNFNASGSDTTSVIRPMFTMKQGQRVLPRAVFPDMSGSNVTVKQRQVQKIFKTSDENGKFVSPLQPVDMGVERFDPSSLIVDLSYSRDSFSTDQQPDGFHITVFKSGSSGLTEVSPKRDSNNDIAYNNDVRVHTGGR